MPGRERGGPIPVTSVSRACLTGEPVGGRRRAILKADWRSLLLTQGGPSDRRTVRGRRKPDVSAVTVEGGCLLLPQHAVFPPSTAENSVCGRRNMCGNTCIEGMTVSWWPQGEEEMMPASYVGEAFPFSGKATLPPQILITVCQWLKLSIKQGGREKPYGKERKQPCILPGKPEALPAPFPEERRSRPLPSQACNGRRRGKKPTPSLLLLYPLTRPDGSGLWSWQKKKKPQWRGGGREEGLDYYDCLWWQNYSP